MAVRWMQGREEEWPRLMMTMRTVQTVKVLPSQTTHTHCALDPRVGYPSPRRRASECVAGCGSNSATRESTRGMDTCVFQDKTCGSDRSRKRSEGEKVREPSECIGRARTNENRFMTERTV